MNNVWNKKNQHDKEPSIKSLHLKMEKKTIFTSIECYFFLVSSEKGNTLLQWKCVVLKWHFNEKTMTTVYVFSVAYWNIITVVTYLFLVLLFSYNSEQNVEKKLLFTAQPSFTVESLTNSAGIQLYSLHDRSPANSARLFTFILLRVVNWICSSVGIHTAFCLDSPPKNLL